MWPMTRKSKIKALAPEVRDCIESMLSAQRFTLAEILAELRRRFPDQADSGGLPSWSALQRYGAKLQRRMAAIKASTEAAQLIHAHAGDDADARSEAILGLVQSHLFEALLALQDANEGPADKRVAMLTRAAADIAALVRGSVQLKQFQAEVAATERRKVLAEHQAKVDKAQRSGGISLDTANLMRQFLGLPPKESSDGA